MEKPVKISDPVGSGDFSIFRATGIEEFRCCFCPNKITAPDILYILKVDDKPRMAHVACVTWAVESIIRVRDRKGSSNDL